MPPILSGNHAEKSRVNAVRVGPRDLVLTAARVLLHPAHGKKEVVEATPVDQTEAWKARFLAGLARPPELPSCTRRWQRRGSRSRSRSGRYKGRQA